MLITMPMTKFIVSEHFALPPTQFCSTSPSETGFHSRVIISGIKGLSCSDAVVVVKYEEEATTGP